MKKLLIIIIIATLFSCEKSIEEPVSDGYKWVLVDISDVEWSTININGVYDLTNEQFKKGWIFPDPVKYDMMDIKIYLQIYGVGGYTIFVPLYECSGTYYFDYNNSLSYTGGCN